MKDIENGVKSLRVKIPIKISHAGNRAVPGYRSWDHMLQRCYNKNSINYEYYGGRGVTVCKRWIQSFDNFIEDMGQNPGGMTIDRLDPEKGYYKENCRWATTKEQTNNKRKKKWRAKIF
jgi:hypothetical protein